jgi:hypothetical protein
VMVGAGIGDLGRSDELVIRKFILLKEPGSGGSDPQSPH